MKRFYSSVLLSCACTALLAGTALAATLDAPTLSFVRAGRTVVTLQVTAGNSGAPNGFTLEWLPAATYEALGGWPADGDPRILKGDFHGVPTYYTENGTDSYQLPPVDEAGVQIGNLFDETGVSTVHHEELLEGTSYVVRVRANASGSDAASAPSATVSATTLQRGGQDCTYTQGYWKNHQEAWPVGNVTLGTVNYTQAQLLQIFNQPAAGNGLVSLSHQLIAAKLNIAQGASAPSGVLTAISQADAMIGGLVVPPIGSGSLSPGSTSGLTGTLDNFNQGITGPGHCGATPTHTPTWGGLKTLYR